MGSDLPQLTRQEFGERLARRGTVESRLAEVLYIHYTELARWNPGLSLIGPGTTETLVERHYGESLAALPLLPPEPGHLLDVGSGAGFPGWVLAAARPDLRVTLVEPNGRKATFLRAAARRAGVTLDVVDGRVDLILPEGIPTAIDHITVRALKLEPEVLSTVATRLRARGEVLFWSGRDAPRVPRDWLLVRDLPLPGRESRILGYRPSGPEREDGVAE